MLLFAGSAVFYLLAAFYTKINPPKQFRIVVIVLMLAIFYSLSDRFNKNLENFPVDNRSCRQ